MFVITIDWYDITKKKEFPNMIRSSITEYQNMIRFFKNDQKPNPTSTYNIKKTSQKKWEAR